MTDYYLFTLSNGIVTPAPFWLMVVLRIYVASTVFQPYRDLEKSSGDAGNRTPDLLLHKPSAKPIGHRRSLAPFLIGQ